MNAFVTEAFSLLGVGLAVIGLRLYVRVTLSGFKGLHADDYLMVLAAVAYSVETYLAYSVGTFWKGLANNGMTDEERRLLDPESDEYRLRVNGSMTQVAGWCTYTFLLWTIKAAMCAFYLRLTEGVGYRKRIHAGFGLIGATWIAVLLSILLGCRPLSKNWQIYPDPGNFCQPAISRIDIFVTVVLNVLTDLYLMSIPIPLLWQSSLRPLKKAGLIVLFSGGIFVMVAGILRCVLIITDPVNGAQQAGSWAVRETFVAVVTSNLPMISPFLARLFRPIIGSLRSLSLSSSKMSKTTRSDKKPGAFRLEDKNPRRGMGPRSVNPLPDFSVNGSEEHIYIRDDGKGAHTRYGKTAGHDTELESGYPTHTRSGVIVKQTSVEVTASRGSIDAEDIGDYYLVKQSNREADRFAGRTSDRKQQRLNFGIGRAL
ncbi:hypothetical protein BT67DRAFT_433933 [Trichocladium antarcticum]|uniref:Rhodopsin domain-containing protein n=1 Tax=Trichocladium antarcticum TaxID=1450529 RepID=A0AAN6UKG4_9PEZI|nr:hypothetical protein BT67DRAFT_433933 [Trichocladium antarcticum]